MLVVGGGLGVVGGAGVAKGFLGGFVFVFAFLDACRTQVGNQAHNGRVGAVKLAELYSLSNRITNRPGQSGYNWGYLKTGLQCR